MIKQKKHNDPKREFIAKINRNLPWLTIFGLIIGIMSLVIGATSLTLSIRNTFNLNRQIETLKLVSLTGLFRVIKPSEGEVPLANHETSVSGEYHPVYPERFKVRGILYNGSQYSVCRAKPHLGPGNIWSITINPTEGNWVGYICLCDKEGVKEMDNWAAETKNGKPDYDNLRPNLPDKGVYTNSMFKFVAKNKLQGNSL